MQDVIGIKIKEKEEMKEDHIENEAMKKNQVFNIEIRDWQDRVQGVFVEESRDWVQLNDYGLKIHRLDYE